MSRQDQNNPATQGTPAGGDKCGPELLGLLGELGSQEDRILLKGLGNWREPRRLKAQDLLQKNSPWLSNLEKHILAVHRDELGLLFHDACLRKLLTSQRIGGMIFLNPVDQKDPHKPQNPAAWRQAAKAERERVASLSELSDPLDVLDQLLNPATADGVGLLATAEAGFLVRPSETLAMYIAHGTEEAGDPKGAADKLREVYEEPCSYRNRLVAAGNLGQLAANDDRMDEALRWYELGATGAEPYPSFACSWAFFSLQLGDERSWRNVAATFENSYESDDPSFEIYCRRLAGGRLAGGWLPTTEANKLLRRIDPGESEHVQKIYHSFL